MTAGILRTEHNGDSLTFRGYTGSFIEITDSTNSLKMFPEGITLNGQPFEPGGSMGATGVQGVTGPAGSGTENGATGLQGVTGLNGEQGVTGPSGSGDGSTGLQGVTGLNGTTGDQGVTGIQGETGAIGAQGITGTQGDTGLQGVTGISGIQGLQGATGVVGRQGEQGNTGIAGSIGYTGIQGATGAQLFTSKVVHAETSGSFDLTENQYHVFGTMTSMTVTFATPQSSDIVNEYLFRFVSGGTPTSLTISESVTWVNNVSPTIAASKTYEISVIDGFGVWAEY